MRKPNPPSDRSALHYQESDVEAAALEATKQHEEELLDEALAETFPASDPVAIGISKPPVNRRKN